MNYSKKHLKHIAYRYFTHPALASDNKTFDEWYSEAVEAVKNISKDDNCFMNQNKLDRIFRNQKRK